MCAPHTCLRSSMDRISDSGSDDWGSTPYGDTKQRHDIASQYHAVVLLVGLFP